MANNVEYSVKAGKLIITIDVSKAACMRAKPSASGKTVLVGSTGGSVKIDSPDGYDVSFSMNVMAKPA